MAGDAVVVAVPLGVLKAGTIHFNPALPVRKQEAIQRLGFGLLNKVRPPPRLPHDTLVSCGALLCRWPLRPTASMSVATSCPVCPLL